MIGNDRAASAAQAMLRLRRARSALFPPGLFSDPAWDLLLSLFVADALGRHLTGREVSEQCAIPPAVMSRWLVHLSSAGLLVGDGNGQLDDVLTLSGQGMAAMESVMSRALGRLPAASDTG